MTTTITSAAHVRPTRREWLAPIGLLLLSIIPILGGASRLGQLASGAAETAQNARFVESPVPVLIHIVSVTVFCLLGAFQFVPSLRRGRARWHRIAGRVLIPAGAVSALSGMWMAVFYAHAAGWGDLLTMFRLVFGAAMVASIGLGVQAIRRRDFVAHSEWMTRAYAIGVGAGTQALVLIPGAIVFGTTQNLAGALLMAAGWITNLVVAELLIRRRGRRPAFAARVPR